MGIFVGVFGMGFFRDAFGGEAGWFAGGVHVVKFVRVSLIVGPVFGAVWCGLHE